ncbi:NUDIX domain-containing protein [Nonomuraea wenchangensis]|uniref:NUDIX domain-containing protein n=1 Tax=Nonomuraea wenchangensis TaxID=568860 RepID=UPI00378FA454
MGHLSTPPLPTAARVIALDDDKRVLLRCEENGGFWATPGGSLDNGEDHTTALRRELREEPASTKTTSSPEGRAPRPLAVTRT